MEKMDILSRSTLLTDEGCLEKMREIVKDYIIYKQQYPVEEAVCNRFRSDFEQFRQKMHDECLRTFTAFDFMEQLYCQELHSKY